MKNLGIIAVYILYQTKLDYKRSKSAVVDKEIHNYLDSGVFKLHCEIVGCDPDKIRDKILSRRKVNETPKYIYLSELSKVLDLKYNFLYNWCKRNDILIDGKQPKIESSFLNDVLKRL